MELFVDEKKMDAESLTAGTVEETLRQVQARLCEPGQMVVRVRCNGEDVPPGEMEPTMREASSAFDKLEVFTSTRAALVNEAMQQASATLEQTGDECTSIATAINEGRTTDAIDSLRDCLGVWQQIHEATCRSIELLELDPTKTEVDGEPLEKLITGPKEVLLQIKQALVAQDYVLLADVLRYEFDDVITQWQRLITHLEQQANQC